MPGQGFSGSTFHLRGDYELFLIHRPTGRYNLDPSESFLPNLLHHVYSSSLEDLSARRLALLLMIVAFGLQVDDSQLPDSLSRSGAYFHLARAALCAMPITECPDLDLMHALVRYCIIPYLSVTDLNNRFILCGICSYFRAKTMLLSQHGASWDSRRN